jgi:hypothetical protein
MKKLFLLAFTFILLAGCEPVDNRPAVQKATDACIAQGGVPLVDNRFWGEEFKGCQTVEETVAKMDALFDEMLKTYGTSSYYGTSQEDIMEFLRKHNDLIYDPDLDAYCGGNSIGFYNCFYNE